MLGMELFGRAGCSPTNPPIGGAPAVAQAILGLGGIIEHRTPGATACLRRLDSVTRIRVDPSLPLPRMNWCTGHELAHYILDEKPWFKALSHAQRERWCDRLGSWICVPPGPLRREATRPVAAVARAFVVPQTSIFLRIAEEEIELGVDVVTSERVYRRGRVPWPLASSRTLAARPGLCKGRRLLITDEPGRVALVAG
jgi:hypothetical protein